MDNKKIVICGITGNIGQQTIEVCKKLKFKIIGCSYFNEHDLCKTIVAKNKIKNILCCENKEKGNCHNFLELISKSKPDLVVNAVVGFAGLEATIATLQNKIDLALANKESLVVAGTFVTKLAKKNHVKIFPIDSEHTSLMQLILYAQKPINQIYITCSGGNFLTWKNNQQKLINWKQATKHPNWNMGEKITIDSNTLMNKCFEVIEAYWYFKTKKINVLLDPKSIVHSAIMFDDGGMAISKIKSDMKQFIALAINNFNVSYLMKIETMNVSANNIALINKNIKPLKWAYDVMNDTTNSLGIILNAANEAAIFLFKIGKIKFNEILKIIDKALTSTYHKRITSLSKIKTFHEFVYKKIINFYSN